MTDQTRSQPRGFRKWADSWLRMLHIGGKFQSYVDRHRGPLITAILLSFVYAGIRLLEPWPIQIVFDQAILGKETRFLGIDFLDLLGGNRVLLLFFSSLAVLVIALLSGSVYYIQSLILARVGQDIVRDLREDVFHQMLRLSLSFHRRYDTGDLLMRLTGDMILLREMIIAMLVTMTGEIIMLISFLVLMATVSVKLTLVTMVLAPGLFFLFRWFRGQMVEAARKQRKREGRLARAVAEVLIAIPMIQTFTAEAKEDARFRKICKKSERAGLRGARLEAAMQRMVEIFVAVGTALVLWFGVREILEGKMTPGVFLVFLAYLRAVYKPVRKLSKVTQRTSRASAAAERILEVLHARRDVKNSKGSIEAPALRGAIQFKDVDFSYEDGSPALREIDFSVQPGERVAVVGPTGAGKSTLFSLILRLHKPQTGEIAFDGVNAQQYTLRSVRRQISYLPQEPFIVGGTIRENLLYGRPDADDAALWEALRAAGLVDFVRELPEELGTRISPRGQSLSGGQKQRLAIARAILKDAPILLLDEPTTALDARTESELLESLEKLRDGRTTFTIAHRISTIRSADRVLVIDGGRLVETGTPDELLGRESLFRFLADIQEVAPVETVPGGTDEDVETIRRTGELEISSLAESLRSDPDLKGVVKLLEPSGPKKLARELAEIAGADPRSSLQVIKQRIGQRVLLRVDSAERNRPPLYVKLFSGRGGQRQSESMKVIRAAIQPLGIDVPEPLAYSARFRALVLGECPGTPLLDSVRQTGERSADFCRGLGRTLAQMHAAIPLPEKICTTSDEPNRLEKPLGRLAELESDLGPEHAAAIRFAVDAWKVELSAITVTSSDGTGERGCVAIHGDFYPDQVLVRQEDGSSTTLFSILDWDEFCQGDAERDVGNFEAHLILEAAAERLGVGAAERLSRVFVEGYSSERSLDPQLLAWYKKGDLLRLAALYANPDFGRFPPNSRGLSLRLLGMARAIEIPTRPTGVPESALPPI